MSKFILHHFLSSSHFLPEHFYPSVVHCFINFFLFKMYSIMFSHNFHLLLTIFLSVFFLVCVSINTFSGNFLSPFLYLCVDACSFLCYNSSGNVSFCPIIYFQEIFNGKELKPHSRPISFPFDLGFWGVSLLSSFLYQSVGIGSYGILQCSFPSVVAETNCSCKYSCFL